MRIIIVGGGVIGLGIGWKLSRLGCQVALYERNQVGRGASWAAAGMLSPLAEAHTQEAELLKLGLESSNRYPEWVRELQEESQIDIDYRKKGTLMVALDRDDRADLQHHFEMQKSFDLPVDWLTGNQARALEPALSPRVVAAIHCPSDLQVNGRLMTAALTVAFQKAGGKLFEQTAVTKINIKDQQVTGIHINSEFVPADLVIVAAGAWLSQVEGLPKSYQYLIRPVKGQILGLQMDAEPIISHVIHAPDAYLVPRSNGSLVVGATVEEQGFDTHLTAGGVFELLRGAWEALPGIYEFPIVDTFVSLRPASRDNAPILGLTSVDGLILAAGHFRKGILLTPVTCDEISQLVLTGIVSEVIKPFNISRFETLNLSKTDKRSY